jgi:hypothetical protein
MNTTTLFLMQLGASVLASLLLARYLRASLRRVLVELCGTEERAEFWTAFSNLLLTLTPAMFALGFMPIATTGEELFIEFAGQLRWNLFGFIAALVAIGSAVAFFALVAPRPKMVNG